MDFQYAKFGEISEGTLRAEDLLEAFGFELCRLVNLNEEWCLTNECGPSLLAYRRLLEAAELVDADSEEADELVAQLCDALNEFAPPFAYFGAHPGDGALYGFWVSWDQIEAEELPRVADFADLDTLDESESGFALVVNDHGNATLVQYDYMTKEWRSVWAVV